MRPVRASAVTSRTVPSSPSHLDAIRRRPLTPGQLGAQRAARVARADLAQHLAERLHAFRLR
jgi:hypothetical protein